MKKFKHILAAVLAVLLLLTACGTVPPEPTNTEQTNPTEATDEKPPFAIRPRPGSTLLDSAAVEMQVNCQYLPQVVDNPDNLPVLKWVCIPDYLEDGDYGSVWSEAAAIELNQMLADRNMPFRVQFVIVTSDYFDSKNYYTAMDWFARPEVQAELAEADLLFIHYLSQERAKEYFMPLTEYAKGNATPSLKNAVPHEINWQNSTVDGEIYGISQSIRRPLSGGWSVDADVLTKYGLTIEDFQKDYWDIDETLKKLSEASGIKKLIKISSNSSISGSFALDVGIENIYPGIAIDPMDEYFTGIGSVFAVEYVNQVPTVVNTLDTELTQKIQDAVIRYRDQYAAPTDGSADIKLRYCFTYGDRPYQTASESEIPVTPSCYNASESVILTNISGVAATSQYQKEAVTLLSLIAEDEEFRMQLLYGKEGRDYTFDAKSNYRLTKQEDGSFYHMSFLSPWSHFSGINDSLPQYEGMTALETYLEMIENAEAYYAVPFDYSGLQEELNEVYTVCQYYFYRFAGLTEEKYAEMLNKINAAGGEKIMTELQRQLDAWVKANPGKPVTPNRL